MIKSKFKIGDKVISLVKNDTNIGEILTVIAIGPGSILKEYDEVIYVKCEISEFVPEYLKKDLKKI